MNITTNADWIGGAWGRFTTHALAILLGIQPIVAGLDPSLYTSVPWLHWAGPAVAIAIVLLSEWAPKR